MRGRRLNKQLILMRHAKSSHGDPGLSDHQRPLNSRGRRDSPRMARWLSDQGYEPEIVLCSTSQRTRETLQLMLDQFSGEPEIRYCDSLYLSAPESILWTISSEHGGHSRVLVLGHNPGMSMVSSVLSRQALQMPTAAAAVLGLPAEPPAHETPSHWLDDLSQQTPLQLAAYMYPKGLDSHGEVAS